MPLRADVRHLYNTAEYRRERREEIARQGGPVCSKCKQIHPRVNLAHLNHDPQDRTPGNRVLLCPRDHARNDARQRAAMTRRTRAARIGQRWLWQDVRMAPYPVHTWPMEVRQVEMFAEAS